MGDVVTNTYLKWAIKWRSTNQLDGLREYLEGDGEMTRLFNTRRECQQFIKEHYGYIARRKDLRVEPHCWRMPKAVRVKVTVGEQGG